MGRGASKARGGSGGSGAAKPAGSMLNTIDKTGFKYDGMGQYELDIPDFGGATILDESDSTRALQHGFLPGQRAYSMQVYDNDGRVTFDGWYEYLNDAKYYAKNHLKALVNLP